MNAERQEVIREAIYNETTMTSGECERAAHAVEFALTEWEAARFSTPQDTQ